VFLVRIPIIIFVFSGFAWFADKWSNPRALSAKTWTFLTCPATGASRICYFHALETGDASKVAPIDSLSLMLVAVAFRGEGPSIQDGSRIAPVASGVILLPLNR